MDVALGRARGLGAHAQAEGDVFEHRHVAEQRVVLEHEAHLAVARGGSRGVFVVQANGPAVGQFEAGDDAQQRGLAGAGGAQQRHQFAGLDAQADVFQRFVSSEDFANVLDFDAHACS